MKEFIQPIWKQVPFLRLLLPLIAGIILSYYLTIPILLTALLTTASIVLFIFYSFLSPSLKYMMSWISGFVISIIFICVGYSVYYSNDIQHNKEWIGNNISTDSIFQVTIQEPLTEKTKSYKAVADANFVFIDHEWKKIKGNIILYFKKENGKPNLEYGSTLIIHKPLQLITNSGNPGAFNYKQYCAFQHIYAQVFLDENNYSILPDKEVSFLQESIFSAQRNVLSVLKENIKDADAAGIAEALLIGYRDDLDKDIVQAYSNTGVVHIIAISGLHIAMIYGLLLFVLKPFRKFKLMKWLQPIIILFILWSFTFVAGAAPSILRSTVMFSFIIIGTSFNKRSNIYNNLAASAFVILLFNPYSLWDVGFQLSYAAVLSIVLFQKNINHWFYFENKLLRNIWQLNAVTIAAQILTLPIILFYFHQFPNFFLLTNLFAVPFSGLILYGELLLLMVGKLEILNEIVGDAVNWCIELMNRFIINVNSIPFSSWENIQINSIQTIILYLFIMSIAYWLIKKKKNALILALSFMVFFSAIRCADIFKKYQQQKIIVYNVPQHQAIDLIDGRKYQFIGDDALKEDGFLRNFHLKPARILNRITPTLTLENVYFENNIIHSATKHVIIVDKPIYSSPDMQKIKVSALIISQNPKLNMEELAAAFDCEEIVFDSSNPLWKINKWKKDCEQLHLRHHSVSEQGAFEMEL